ncbi:kinase-like domain-containing protein [Globomyces pollinis-pini]|nr:kinase-like domain-containing protein [Globomyces pollinis-pini]
MVFDLLSQSLFDYFKSVHFSPFSLRQIQSFAHQLLISVAFLHDLGLIHTDLKPENLMLVDNETKAQPVKNSKTKTRKMLVSTKIILIDFGSTIADIDHHSNVVSTRHYRAPEIILNLGWSYPCDIWSLGCILVELYTGIALFQTHEDMEHLKMMEIVLGAFPTHMINKVPDMNEGIFRYNGTINYPSSNTEQSSQAFLERMETIQSIIRPRTEFEQLFLEFIKSLLTFDPYQRINAHQALNHPFITFR